MTRRAFDNDGSWTIDLADSFARTEAETDDSPLCIIFTHHDKSVSGSFFELWNGEWGPDPRPPEEMWVDYLRSCVSLLIPSGSAIDHDLNIPGMRGKAFLMGSCDAVKIEKRRLRAWTAVHTHVAEIVVEFEGSEQVPWALETWRSLRFDPSDLVRQCMESPPALTSLRRGLEMGNCLQLVEQLREMGHGVDMLRLLRVALRDKSTSVRETACLALGDLRSPDAIPDLRRMLADPNCMVRLRAADALCDFRELEGILPVLIDALSTPEPVLPRGINRIMPPCLHLCMPEEHYHAARILGYLGTGAHAARPQLRAALHSGSAMVRAAAARTLLALNEPVKDLLPPLRQALHGSDLQTPRERVWAAEALFDLGEPATALLPTISELVDASDDTASHYAKALVARLTRRT